MARIIKSGSADGSREAGEAVKDLADIAAEARAVVLDARKQAARIVAEARAESAADRESAAEQAYAEAFARGQNDGYADGHRQGVAEGKTLFSTEADGLLELAERAVTELAEARATLLHEARCEMLDFALELAEKIVGRVAAAGNSAARENLRKVLELADCAQKVTVKVNPAQRDALAECLPALIETLGRADGIELVGDESISPGGVRLLSGRGEIDATIETQLVAVAEALLGAPDQDWEAGCYEPTTAPVQGEEGKRPFLLNGDEAADATDLPSGPDGECEQTDDVPREAVESEP